MEVAALCIRLLVTVLISLWAHYQKVEADLRIKPNKLQFFEYDNITFTCEEVESSTKLNASRKLNKELPKCLTNEVKPAVLSCTIKCIYPTDSGEYWCEAGGGRRSNSINIFVTKLHSCHIYPVLRTVFTIVMVAVLLLLLGLFHCGRLGGTKNNMSPLTVVTVLISLWAHYQKVEADLRIKPNKLQFFEYDNVTFTCEQVESSTKLNASRTLNKELPKCLTNEVKPAGSSCTIKGLYPTDSGEYWCEAGGGRRSNSINIFVTISAVFGANRADADKAAYASVVRNRRKKDPNQLHDSHVVGEDVRVTHDGCCGNSALSSPLLMPQIKDKDGEREDEEYASQSEGLLHVSRNSVKEQGGVEGGDVRRGGIITQGWHIHMVHA
ncbi:hypothetical protein PAMP_016045 [Pampus punctatissimus]